MAQKRVKLLWLFWVLLGLLAVLFWPLKHQDTKLGPYRLDTPEARYPLPETLQEISGVTYVGLNSIGAQQDESGTIFLYDLWKRSLEETFSYNEVGDYEDIAYVGDNLYYLLRSDGVLFSYDAVSKMTSRYPLATGAKNNEGLAYDPVTNSLLISTKSKAGKGKSFKDERYIYSFDLESKMLAEEPFFVVNIKDLKSFIHDDTVEIKFRPAALAVHPVAHTIYIISAVDHFAAIFDRKGKVLDVASLDPEIFYKPEGITFTERGNLLIANEGDAGIPPTLVEFAPTE